MPLIFRLDDTKYCALACSTICVIKNKNGYVYFSASHVILRTVKAVPEYGKGKSRHSAVGGEDGELSPPLQAIPDENDNQVLYLFL